MKVAGEAFGAFTEAAPSPRRSSTSPRTRSKIDGVAMMAGEAVGSSQAFKQTGRPVPPAAEVGMDKGFFGYWQQNQATYHASSTSLPPVPAARALAEVTGRMLAGQGVKLNTLVGKGPGDQRRHAGGLGGAEVDHQRRPAPSPVTRRASCRRPSSTTSSTIQHPWGDR